MQAEVIAVPPFSREHLERGHAIHFRCATPDAAGLRVDIMTKLRGVDDFEALWQRRTTIVSDDGGEFQLLSLADLVKAKKTQRDKDWPMIRRLIEADYFAGRDRPTGETIEFWLRELRTPGLLIETAAAYEEVAHRIEVDRPLIRFARNGDEISLAEALLGEENAVREADRRYWRPLKAELEQIRPDRFKSS